MKGLVCVTFIAGRCGSSLTMGLLEKMGYNLGPINGNRDSNNPMGYFEITEWLEEIREEYDELSQFMPRIPKTVTRLDPKKYFNTFPAAIKCPYVFLAPKMCKKIYLRRNIKDQAESIRKMNTKEGDFENWLKEWYEAYPPKGCIIDYEGWKEPYINYLKIENHLNAPIKLSESEVNEWVNQDFMNIS